VLGLAYGGLWYLAPPGDRGGATAVVAISEPAQLAPAPPESVPDAPTPAPEPSTTVRKPPHREPRPAGPGTATPQSRSLSDLPGQVFYDEQGSRPRVVRLDHAGDTQTVLTAPHTTLGISPDGNKIAYVQDGSLLVADTDGGKPDRPYDGKVSGEQAPVWSPDGGRLLVDAHDPAVLDVADGTLQALPSGLAGGHFRWSGDGRKLVYATASGQLKVAEATAHAPTVTVPALGDPDRADNPSGLGACRPVSVDATGSRVVVALRQVDGGDDGSAVANAVVDTATGDADPLPVSGIVIGAVFDAEGDLLVRTWDQGKTTLSLFSPGNALLVQAHEPSRLRELTLVAYTN
jgi:TolB protein